MTQVVQIKNLSKSFGSTRLLKNLDWEIQSGDVIGLLGKNGSGKSTLLSCLLGLHPTDNATEESSQNDSEISLFDEPNRDLSPIVREKLGYVPQTCSEVPWMTVRQTLDFRAQCYPTWNKERESKLCSHWQLNLDARVGDLSVGQAQKLMLILALCYSPDLLILDEPAASLDPSARRELMTEIIELASDNNKAVVFSTHITSDLERIANKVAILNEGKIQCFMPLDDLKETITKLVVELPCTNSEEELVTESKKLLNLPNCIKQYRQGNEITCIIEKHSAINIDAVLPEGANVQDVALSLEDIFVELTR